MFPKVWTHEADFGFSPLFCESTRRGAFFYSIHALHLHQPPVYRWDTRALCHPRPWSRASKWPKALQAYSDSTANFNCGDRTRSHTTWSTSFDILWGWLGNLEDRIHIPREWNEPMITFRGGFTRTENSNYGVIITMIVVHQVDNQLLPNTLRLKKADTILSLHHHIDSTKLI